LTFRYRLRSAMDSINAKLNRTKIENPWFIFSDLYSGAPSAWFRLKFPHLTCGSLASSAVVLAVYNYTEFDQQIGESAGPECKEALQEITQLIEHKLATSGKELKASFDAANLEIDGDFFICCCYRSVMIFGAFVINCNYLYSNAFCRLLFFWILECYSFNMEIQIKYASLLLKQRRLERTW
ncbi:hypothetical protein GYH30_003057, partial [Glycine max]